MPVYLIHMMYSAGGTLHLKGNFTYKMFYTEHPAAASLHFAMRVLLKISSILDAKVPRCFGQNPAFHDMWVVTIMEN